jgi:phospho-N-acetylmuramoyl-pentapeptide-transferase
MFLGIFLLAGIGFVDDYLKVRRRHNRGLFWKRKNLIVLVAAAVPVILLQQATSVSQTLSFTRADWPGWELPAFVYIVWATFIVFATSHAVNVTDGLDGLAAGSGMFSFFGFAAIAFWGFRNPELFPMVNPLDLAVLAVAFAAACGGFLWWNAAPARVFMGDVGSLSIGSALGLLAVTTNTQLLLPILCALNVIEIGSVAVQMGVFKLSGRRKRLFRMSPIHHHFEKGDQPWPETTIIIRFWLIAGIFVLVALGIFVADFTRLARETAGLVP